MRFWVGRFGLKFAGEIRKKRAGHHSNWQWHLDEVFVKISGERFYLWRAVDHEGEVLECYVSKRRDRHAARKFLIKTMRKHGSPKIITTDKLASYCAAFREIGVAEQQLCGGRTNSRYENSHFPFRRRERVMQKFKNCATLQRFTSLHSQIYNNPITKDASKPDKFTSKNAVPLFRSGSNFALHSDLALRCLKTT